MRNTWLSFDIDNNSKEHMYSINSTLDSTYIKIMDYHNIHMTSVFFGKRLKGINKDRLKEINSIINKYIKAHNKINLCFDKFSLFPPNKNNIVVALYKHNNTLTSIVNDIINSLPEYSNNTEIFIPHITVGKLNVGHKIDLTTIENYPDISINGLVFNGDKIKYMDNNYSFI